MTRSRAALVLFAITTAIGSLEAIYRINNDLTYGGRPSILGHFASELTATWISGLLFFFLIPFFRRFRIGRSNWLSVIPWHAAGLAVYSLAHTFLMWAVRVPLFPMLGLGRYNYGTVRERIVMEFAADVFTYSMFAAALHAAWVFAESREREVALAHARLENLQLQLQPHFLFNSLNAISNLVYEDPKRADEMIARLSELLRRTLDSGRTVSLAEEIQTTELYLDMMQTRFEERLSVQIDVDPEARGVAVPHFLLQPLIENSLKHGVDPVSKRVSITISARRQDERLRIEVSDTGPGSRNGAAGVGLSNTASRLDQLYGKAHSFRTASEPGFRCIIEIPCGSS